MRRTLLPAAALLAATVGCDELDKNGRLDNGEFQYECVGPGDAACNGAETIFGFDLDRDVVPIATGGRFKLAFDSDLVEDGAEEIIAASSEVVSSDGSSFAYNQAGTVDFLAKNEEDEVIDFVDFTGLEPDAIGVFTNGSKTSTITLPSSGRLIVAAAPMSGGQVLGGGFDWSWSVSDDDFSVTVAPSSEQETGTNVIEISASGDASGVLTVSSGSLSATIAVIAGDGSSSTTSSSGTGGAGGAGGAGGVGGAGGSGGGGAGGAGGAGGTGGAGGAAGGAAGAGGG